LIFVMVKCGVLFEVRTGFLNNIYELRLQRVKMSLLAPTQNGVFLFSVATRHLLTSVAVSRLKQCWLRPPATRHLSCQTIPSYGQPSQRAV
jgi:hypothetical protein